MKSDLDKHLVRWLAAQMRTDTGETPPEPPRPATADEKLIRLICEQARVPTN